MVKFDKGLSPITFFCKLNYSKMGKKSYISCARENFEQYKTGCGDMLWKKRVKK